MSVNLFDVLEQVKVAERRWLEAEYGESGVFFRFRELESAEFDKVMTLLASHPLPSRAQIEAAQDGNVTSIPQEQLIGNIVTMAEVATALLQMQGLVIGWRGLTVSKFYEMARRQPNYEPEKANEEVEYDPKLADQVLTLCAAGSTGFKMFLATSALSTTGLKENEKKN